jgi:hypothetical protein
MKSSQSEGRLRSKSEGGVRIITEEFLIKELGEEVANLPEEDKKWLKENYNKIRNFLKEEKVDIFQIKDKKSINLAAQRALDWKPLKELGVKTNDLLLLSRGKITLALNNLELIKKLLSHDGLRWSPSKIFLEDNFDKVISIIISRKIDTLIRMKSFDENLIFSSSYENFKAYLELDYRSMSLISSGFSIKQIVTSHLAQLFADYLEEVTSLTDKGVFKSDDLLKIPKHKLYVILDCSKRVEEYYEAGFDIRAVINDGSLEILQFILEENKNSDVIKECIELGLTYQLFLKLDRELIEVLCNDKEDFLILVQGGLFQDQIFTLDVVYNAELLRLLIENSELLIRLKSNNTPFLVTIKSLQEMNNLNIYYDELDTDALPSWDIVQKQYQLNEDLLKRYLAEGKILLFLLNIKMLQIFVDSKISPKEILELRAKVFNEIFSQSSTEMRGLIDYGFTLNKLINFTDIELLACILKNSMNFQILKDRDFTGGPEKRVQILGLIEVIDTSQKEPKFKENLEILFRNSSRCIEALRRSEYREFDMRGGNFDRLSDSLLKQEEINERRVTRHCGNGYHWIPVTTRGTISLEIGDFCKENLMHLKERRKGLIIASGIAGGVLGMLGWGISKLILGEPVATLPQGTIIGGGSLAVVTTSYTQTEKNISKAVSIKNKIQGRFISDPINVVLIKEKVKYTMQQIKQFIEFVNDAACQTRSALLEESILFILRDKKTEGTLDKSVKTLHSLRVSYEQDQDTEALDNGTRSSTPEEDRRFLVRQVNLAIIIQSLLSCQKLVDKRNTGDFRLEDDFASVMIEKSKKIKKSNMLIIGK